MTVIYADVLIILNTYVNFALLRLTAVLTHRLNSGRLRTLAAAFFGGIYSLVILFPSLHWSVSLLSKLLSGAVIVLIAFGFINRKSFLRSFLTFFSVSFIFAGSMLALWIFVSPDTMIYNNGETYFQIDTLTLILATGICYGVLRLIFFLSERHTPRGSIYEIEIYILGEKISCRGLYDSGNSLKDAFSSLPVMAVSTEKLSKTVTEQAIVDETLSKILKPRYVPCSTLGGDAVILTVCPEKVRIKGIGVSLETNKILIGLCKEKIRNGEFEALLPGDIFQICEGENSYV